jgi:hypothetical protein
MTRGPRVGAPVCVARAPCRAPRTAVPWPRGFACRATGLALARSPPRAQTDVQPQTWQRKVI